MAAAIRLSQQHSCSFDHLVGAGEQRRQDFEARALAVLISSTFVIWTGKSRCRNAMLKTAHGWRKLRHEAQLISVCLPRAQPAVEQSRALPGETYLGFSLFALGVPDSAPVSPRQLAVQSASAARQSFGTAYGMSLLSGGFWLMLHAINP